MTTQTTQTTNCLFCCEPCPVRNETIQYSGCDCTLSYHTPCINQWFAKQGYQCPLCRKSIQLVDQNEQQNNECTMYIMLTVAVNIVFGCIL